MYSSRVYGPQRAEPQPNIPGPAVLIPESTGVENGEPGYIPEVNEKVLMWIDYFTGPGRKVFERWLARSGRYMNLMADILAEEGVPRDLTALVFVESGFNVHARSWAHAVGPWQFIKGTAKIFGLTMDRWVDERRDPVKSTVAAAKYLKRLYELFQSWPLAVASYNTGEGNVLSAIRRHGTSDFWALRLPRETQEYVPQFMAVLILARNPAQYGFDVEYESPIEFDEIKVGGLVDLRTVASICEVPFETIKSLNPGLIRHKTPPRSSGVTLRVPPGLGDLCSEKLALMPPPPPMPEEKPPVRRAGKYTIRRGDTLGGIATEFGVSLAALKKANRLKGSAITAGKVLSIPGRAAQNAAKTESSSGNSAGFEYVVKPGDTVYGLSKKFGVSFPGLLKANNFTARHRLKAGEKILVPVRSDISLKASEQRNAWPEDSPSAPQLQ